MLLTLQPSSALAQTKYWLGLGAGFTQNWHNAQIELVPGEPECGPLTYGEGRGKYASLVGEIGLLPWLRGSARLTYTQLGANMIGQCTILEIAGENDEILPVTREFDRRIRLDYGLVELGARVAPFDFPLHVIAGFGFGVPFVAEHGESERLLSPPGTRYDDGSIKRTNFEEELTNTQLRTILRAGIGYDFMLPNEVEVTPELVYSHTLSEVVTTQDWHAHSLRLGVAVKLGLEIKKPEPPEKDTVQPPPPPPPKKPIARIGTATDASINILETYVTETFPLLPYVFFEKGSATLPAKYANTSPGTAGRFQENELPRETLDIYYHLLDIIGARMQRDPEITITLIGSTDDKGVEKGNDSLAIARATSVAEYLSGVWDIPGERISIRTQALPPIPTAQTAEEGDEENRRVEIVSDYGEVFRPIVHERFSEFDITPPTMTLELGAESEEPLERWTMTVKRVSTLVREFNGAGAPPATIDWKLEESLAAELGEREDLTAELTIISENGERSTSSVDIPVYKRTNAYEVGRLSLIVFEFDKSRILPHNAKMIRTFVNTAIKEKSTAVITGSTDFLGEAEHNQELSTARAENVKKIITDENPEITQLEARGIGEAPELYDNKLPEGRFYCRTVAVEVKTPLE